MTEIYLGLGSNLGDRLQNLQDAVRQLAPEVHVSRLSSVCETEPWGYTDQPRFLNLALAAETSLEPHALLVHLKKIEANLKRETTFRNGPRTIDLDILFYGNLVLNTPDLVIPHPRLVERAFVLVPLDEIAPGFVHPVLHKTVHDLAGQTDTSSVSLFQAATLDCPQEELNKRTKPAYPLEWGSRTFVMGIINVTPDSFSGDGLLSQPDAVRAAVAQACRFVQEGADILDIGGESTRPGSQPVDAEEEMQRILPVIRAVRQLGLPVILSVDTYKARVAEAALQAGADWINDVWALRGDPELAAVASDHHAPIILMHNRSKPNDAALDRRLGGRYVGAQYKDLLGEIKQELLESVESALSAGVEKGRIILDAGIGFGKTVNQNLDLLNRQDEICSLGYPVLLGPSRKSFIGYTLDAPPDQRLEGTAAAVAVGISRGVDIIRVHDVAAMVKVARMTDAIVRRK